MLPDISYIRVRARKYDPLNSISYQDGKELLRGARLCLPLRKRLSFHDIGNCILREEPALRCKNKEVSGTDSPYKVNIDKY